MIYYTASPDSQKLVDMYAISYQELQEEYYRLCAMNDEEFMDNLVDAAHLACITTWFKETGQYAVADKGIVHELIHLMSFPDDCDLSEIRKLFKKDLHLS